MDTSLNNTRTATEPEQPQKGGVKPPRKRETKQERRRRVRQEFNQLFLERQAKQNQ